jgi:hypothetical protein
MNIIEVRPSQKFKGAWAAVEAPGVEPAFATNTPKAKADAMSYARASHKRGTVEGSRNQRRIPRLFS